MTDTSTDATTDADSLLLYDLELTEDHPPQCEGQNHHRGILGHDPAEAAGFWLIAPCHAEAIALCASRVTKLRRDGILTCGRCNESYVIERFRILPIDGSTL